MDPNIILTVILAVAVFGKAGSVAVATSALLMIRLLNIDKYLFPAIEKSGMFWGLVLLIAAILIPIANGKISAGNIKNALISWSGMVALLLSFFTTYLSGLGLDYLNVQGHTDILPSLILGAVAAAVFLGGVPVGPFITTGILALFVKLFNKQ